MMSSTSTASGGRAAIAGMGVLARCVAGLAGESWGMARACE